MKKVSLIIISSKHTKVSPDVKSSLKFQIREENRSVSPFKCISLSPLFRFHLFLQPGEYFLKNLLYITEVKILVCLEATFE